MNPLARVGAAAAAALALSLTHFAPAEAARAVKADASYDVSKMVCKTEDDCTESTDATRVEGDIRSMITNHGKSSVVVRAKFGKLYNFKQVRVFSLYIGTNEGVRREVDIFWIPGYAPSGELTISKLDGTELSCSGLAKKVDYTHGTIQLTIPRSCLSNPAWVKTGAIYGRFPNESTGYLDDAHKSGGPIGERPTLGSAVYRG